MCGHAHGKMVVGHVVEHDGLRVDSSAVLIVGDGMFTDRLFDYPASPNTVREVEAKWPSSPLKYLGAAARHCGREAALTCGIER